MANYRNSVVLESGGPTAVINESLRGVYDGWRIQRNGNLYGSLYGVKGLIEENLINLKDIRVLDMAVVGLTPGAAIGASRYSLRRKDGNLKTEDLEKIFHTLDAYKIGYLFLIGGEDSRKNAHTILVYAKQVNRQLTVVHIPKTIDNDLTWEHHDPGYGSAAKFVVWAVTGIDLDNSSLPGAMIDVVMGRNAGWIAASSVLARQKKDYGPHLIYVPEVDFSQDKFLDNVEEMMRKKGRCHIVIAEGVAEKKAVKDYIEAMGGGEFLKKLCGVDDFGHPQLSGSGVFGAVLCYMVKKGLGIKRVRANTFDYLQRSFPGSISRVDSRQAYEVGKEAVLLINGGGEEIKGLTVTLGREEFDYNSDIGSLDLNKIYDSEEGAKRLKSLPLKIVIDGHNIDEEAFSRYIGSLVDRYPEVRILDQKSLKAQRPSFELS